MPMSTKNKRNETYICNFKISEPEISFYFSLKEALQNCIEPKTKGDLKRETHLCDFL
jgi:hypothetical protein